jgi:hypothetical protein
VVLIAESVDPPALDVNKSAADNPAAISAVLQGEP